MGNWHRHAAWAARGILVALFAVLVSAASAFAAAPVVTDSAPSIGPVTGGTVVYINGSNLLGATKVVFGGDGHTGGTQATNVNVYADDSMSATAPPGTGTVNIYVVDALGNASDASTYAQFTYVPVPVVTDVSGFVAFGLNYIIDVEGGTTVTITGTGFTHATEVKFGETPATSMTVDSDTQITAVSPAGTYQDFAHVTVTSVGGTSAETMDDLMVFRDTDTATVTGVSPPDGPEAGGTEVTITGTHFTDTTGVYFGSHAGILDNPAADYDVISDTTIVATAPPGSGTVNVYVANLAGEASCCADAASEFTFLPALGISGVSAVSTGGVQYVDAAGGTIVTVSGFRFTGATSVKIGAVDVSFNVVDEGTITATAPPGTIGDVVHVTVTTPDGTTPETAADLVTFGNFNQPTVTEVNPSSGPTTGGTEVIITGSDFLGATGVYFGGTAASPANPATDFEVLDGTTITATAPAGTGAVDVFVTNSAGVANDASAQFTYLALPTVTGVSTQGDGGTEYVHYLGGTVVTITGTGFTDATEVKFGTELGTAMTVVDDTTITVTAPEGEIGTDVHVLVSAPGGDSTEGSADTVTYANLDRPTVEFATPSSGPATGGAFVTIYGSGFTGAAAVYFGGTEASPGTPATRFVVTSDTSIDAFVPPGTGTVDILVVNVLGEANPVVDGHFTYTTTPVVVTVSVLPGQGDGGLEFVSYTGGTEVTITGTQFTGATDVLFDTVPATDFVVVDDSTITAIAPAGTLDDIADVSVTTPEGTDTSFNIIQYANLNTPAVTSVSPSSGPLTGGTEVTITGTDLDSIGSVYFGGTQASPEGPATSLTLVDGTTIKATAPAGTGTVDVFVSNYLSEVSCACAGAAAQFTYMAVPAVTAVSVQGDGGTEYVDYQGGTSFTLTGTDFTGATDVKVDGVAATDVVIGDDTTITATAPAGTIGVSVHITVTTPSGTSAETSADLVTYGNLATPTVTGISPAAGPEAGGTAVTITGTGFTGAVDVFLGSYFATGITVVNDTTITATTPAGTGVVDVSVNNTLGESNTADAQFTYVVAPAVTSVSTQGDGGDEYVHYAGGTTVSVTGSGFTGATDVEFGTVSGTSLNIIDDNNLTVVAPAGTIGDNVDVTVVTDGGTSNTSGSDIVIYANLDEPTVTGLSPSSGSDAGGTEVTITGTNLDGTSHVYFGGSEASPGTEATSVTVVNGTTVTAVAPAGTGTVGVFVDNILGDISPDGGSAAEFTYVPAAAVTGVSTQGDGGTEFVHYAGGTTATIIGSNFTGATDVKFGTTSGTDIVVIDDNTVTVTAPSGTLGSAVHVTVVTAAGASAESSADLVTFANLNTPAITGISPSSGPEAGGTEITITGTNLIGPDGVYFGGSDSSPGTPADSMTVVDDTTIKVTAPAGTGTVDIHVFNILGIGSASAGSATEYTYAPGPAVTSVKGISHGGVEYVDYSGGTSVTINGSGFSGATTVKFGTASATSLTVNSDTKITATAPSGTLGDTVHVTVTTPGGTSAESSNDQVTFVSQFQPGVTGVSPSSGPEAGGTEVTISGSAFNGTVGVYFGGTMSGGGTAATNVTIVDNNTITATAPAGTGTVGVFVFNALGTANCCGGSFTYNPAPTVTKLVRNGGDTAGGDTVILTGTGLTGATKVYFGSTLASFAVDSDTKITATSPSGTGNVNVTVVGPNGTSANGPGNLYYYGAPAPVITSFNISTGGEAGGATRTINGSGFTGASEVLFGTTPAASFTVVSDTEITVVTPAGTGVVDVTVEAPGGTSAAKSFTYVPVPAATSISPDNGPEEGGTEVTISGSGFAGASDIAVIFGSETIPVTVDSDTQLRVISPPGTGTVDVKVQTEGGYSDPMSFTYDPAGPPEDSVNADLIQDQLTAVVSDKSAQAIAGAVTKGIALGFSGDTSASIGLGSETAFLAYVPDSGRADPLAGVVNARPGSVTRGPWSAWVDVTGSGLLEGGSGTQLNITGGIGYRLSDDFVVGVIGGQEGFSYSSSAPDGKLEGSGLSIGGYAGWRFERGQFDIAVVGSALNYKVTSGAAEGEFTATRWLLTSGISTDFELGENLTVSPSARVFAVWEDQEGWTDSLATDHAARSFANGTVSGGLTFSGVGLQLGDMDITPYLGLFADYRFDSDGGNESASARVSGGVTVGLSDDAGLDLSGEISGFGSNQLSWSVSGGLSGGF